MRVYTYEERALRAGSKPRRIVCRRCGFPIVKTSLCEYCETGKPNPYQPRDWLAPVKVERFSWEGKSCVND